MLALLSVPLPPPLRKASSGAKWFAILDCSVSIWGMAMANASSIASRPSAPCGVDGVGGKSHSPPVAPPSTSSKPRHSLRTLGFSPRSHNRDTYIRTHAARRGGREAGRQVRWTTQTSMNTRAQIITDDVAQTREGQATSEQVHHHHICQYQQLTDSKRSVTTTNGIAWMDLCFTTSQTSPLSAARKSSALEPTLSKNTELLSSL